MNRSESEENVLSEVSRENLEYPSDQYSELRDQSQKLDSFLKTGQYPNGEKLTPQQIKTIQKTLSDNLRAMRAAKNKARDQYDKQQGKSNASLKLGGKNSPTVDNINDIMKLPEFSSKPIGAARGYIMKTFFKDEASDQNAMSAVLKSFEKNNDQFAEIIKKLYQSKKALEGSEKMLQDFINTIKTEIPR
jgi:uncharacterized protein YeaC (DUF1315 family)